MDTGDTAWVLASAALVLLMTPGLALFYGGMVRAKSVLNMMMMSFGALALISVLWVLYGYSMAFGNDVGGGLVGNPFEFFGLKGLLGTEGVDNGFAGHRAGLHHPVDGLRRLPGRLRDHHRRADLRRHRRPGQVRRLDGLRRRLGHDRLLPGRPLGLRLRRRGVRGRRLDRQQAPGDRLRRRYGGAHQRRCRGPRARPGPRQAPRLRPRPDAAAQPAPGHDRRRPAVVRLVRLQRRLGARRPTARPPRSG